MGKLTFLITGASSFIGYNVALHLIAQGHEVIGISRNPDERVKSIKSASFRLLQADLLEEILIEDNVDVVFHAAAQAPNRNAGAADYVDNHVLATRNLLELAAKIKARKFIFCSSILVFGQVRVKVVDEKTPIINPNLQGVCKYLGELLMQEKSNEMSLLALRLPGLVGKGAHNVWLQKILEQAAENKDIHIINPEAPFNNIVHVDDLAKFIGNLANLNWEGFDMLTLASHSPMTVKRAAELVISSANSRSKITGEEREDYKSFTISIEKAQSMFGYEPSTTEQAIRRFVLEQ